jgi:hypothetical protein
MDLLHKPSVERIRAGMIGGAGMVKLFETLAADAELNEIPVMTLMTSYVADEDEYETGQYVPELHLIVRKVDD